MATARLGSSWFAFAILLVTLTTAVASVAAQKAAVYNGAAAYAKIEKALRKRKLTSVTTFMRTSGFNTTLIKKLPGSKLTFFAPTNNAFNKMSAAGKAYMAATPNAVFQLLAYNLAGGINTLPQLAAMPKGSKLVTGVTNYHLHRIASKKPQFGRLGALKGATVTIGAIYKDSKIIVHGVDAAIPPWKDIKF